MHALLKIRDGGRTHRRQLIGSKGPEDNGFTLVDFAPDGKQAQTIEFGNLIPDAGFYVYALDNHNQFTAPPLGPFKRAGSIESLATDAPDLSALLGNSTYQLTDSETATEINESVEIAWVDAVRGSGTVKTEAVQTLIENASALNQDDLSRVLLEAYKTDDSAVTDRNSIREMCQDFFGKADKRELLVSHVLEQGIESYADSAKRSFLYYHLGHAELSERVVEALMTGLTDPNNSPEIHQGIFERLEKRLETRKKGLNPFIDQIKAALATVLKSSQGDDMVLQNLYDFVLPSESKLAQALKDAFIENGLIDSRESIQSKTLDHLQTEPRPDCREGLRLFVLRNDVSVPNKIKAINVLTKLAESHNAALGDLERLIPALRAQEPYKARLHHYAIEMALELRPQGNGTLKGYTRNDLTKLSGALESASANAETIEHLVGTVLAWKGLLNGERSVDALVSSAVLTHKILGTRANPKKMALHTAALEAISVNNRTQDFKEYVSTLALAPVTEVSIEVSKKAMTLFAALYDNKVATARSIALSYRNASLLG